MNPPAQPECDECNLLGGNCVYFETGSEPTRGQVAKSDFLRGMYFAIRGRCPAHSSRPAPSRNILDTDLCVCGLTEQQCDEKMRQHNPPAAPATCPHWKSTTNLKSDFRDQNLGDFYCSKPPSSPDALFIIDEFHKILVHADIEVGSYLSANSVVEKVRKLEERKLRQSQPGGDSR